MAAIPEMNEELRNNKKGMKKSIIIGSLISMTVYILFAVVIIGVTGLENITDGSIIGLGNILGYKMLVFGIIFGVLTMATSFIANGLALKEMYKFDFRLKEPLSSLLICFIPLIIAILIILTRIDNAFFKIIDVTGAVAGGLMGIFVVLMYWKAKELGDRKPEYSIHKNKIIGFLLISMFLAGIIYGLLKITNFLLAY
jgi:amino acid permease